MRNAPIRALMAFVATVAVGTVMASGSSPALATVEPAAVCPPAWSIVPAAGGAANDAALNAVATLSSRDVWAVGATGIDSFATLSVRGTSSTEVAKRCILQLKAGFLSNNLGAC